MKFIKELLIQEAHSNSGDYQVYHSTYSSAVSTALEIAKSRGYELDDDEIFSIVSSGPRKPVKGDTNRFSIPLYRNDKAVREQLHIQIYNKGGNIKPFELNAYIL